MEHKGIIASGLVLILIVAGMFIFAYLKKTEIQVEEVENPTPEVEGDTISAYDYIESINAKHFFIDGTHTIAGEISMPTPCDLLNWETRIMESYPEQVVIDFEVINESDMCAQVITPQRFKVEFDASEQATVRATLEGREVKLNLVPATPDEDPDDFELFIKG